MKNRVKVGVNQKKKQDEVSWMFFYIKMAYQYFYVLNCFLADAEKLDFDSDDGGRSKKKGGVSSKKSPVKSKKRPAQSPPPMNGKKKKK